MPTRTRPTAMSAVPSSERRRRAFWAAASPAAAQWAPGADDRWRMPVERWATGQPETTVSPVGMAGPILPSKTSWLSVLLL
jgi:hypothetical protein